MGYRRLASDFDDIDLGRFVRFISGKNGNYNYGQLVELLTYGRLDAAMQGATDERKVQLATSYSASLSDAERLGMVITDVYNSVLNGDSGRIIDGIYEGYQGKLNFRFLLRYGIKVKKKWNMEDIPKNITKDEIRSLKLGRGLDKCFSNCPVEATTFSYPEMELKPYYFRFNHRDYWSKDGIPYLDRAAEATKELIGIWLEKQEEDLVSQMFAMERGTPFEGVRVNGFPGIMLTRVTHDVFADTILPYESNLKHMMKDCFRDAPSLALMNAFPEVPLKPYYYASTPNNYWVDENGNVIFEHVAEATREVCNLWLKDRDISFLENIRASDFRSRNAFPGGHTATGMLRRVGTKGLGYTDLVMLAYPGMFKKVEEGRFERLKYLG